MGTAAGVERIDLYLAEIPLRHPWRAATGDLDVRPTIVVSAHRDGFTGWGECPALPDARYDGTDIEGCWASLTDDLIPAALRGDESPPERAGPPASRAAIGLALGDLSARSEGRRLRDLPGLDLDPAVTSVPAGVVVDDVGAIEATLARVASHVEEGYTRVKLKVYPGHDLEWCRAVRHAWPDLCLGVDANGTYSPADTPHLVRLDEMGLAFIEQPFAAERLDDLAALRRSMDTPICLDESIRDAPSLRAAIEAEAADVVSLKWSRLGGLGPAANLASSAAAEGLGVFVGGMIEAGVGRAASTLLAAHPAMSLPGDLSASDRFFVDDIVERPARLRGDRIEVPDGSGLGVDVSVEALRRVTVRTFSGSA